MAGRVVFDGDVREFSEFITGLPEEEARRLRKLLREDKVEFLGEIPEGAVLEEPEWCWFIRENEGTDGEYSRDGKYLYRLATRNDFSREDLIHRESKGLARATGLPYREARKIICLFLALGWEAKTWRGLIEDKKGLFYWVQIAESELEREKYLDMLRRKEVPLIEARNGERIDEQSDDNEELDEDTGYFDDSLYGLSEEKDLDNYLIYRVWKNWTGEVRIPVVTEDNEDENEDSGEDFPDSEIRRLIRSVVTVVSGKRAYEISNRVKNLLNGDRAYRRALKKAWEIRKRLSPDTPLEERIKISRSVL